MESCTRALRTEWRDPSKKTTVALYGDSLTNGRYRTPVQYTSLGIGAAGSAPVRRRNRAQDDVYLRYLTLTMIFPIWALLSRYR
jgi:hypothetical protein